MLLAARVIFGISGENIYILIQPAIAEKWFIGKFLSISMGLANMVASFAGFFAAYIEPVVYEKTRNIQNVAFCMVLSSFLTWVFSVGAFFTEEVLIKKSLTGEKRNQTTTIVSLQENKPLTSELEPQEESQKVTKDDYRLTEIHKEPLFTYKHICHLEPLYWIIILNFCFISMCVFQFTSFMTDLLMKRFGYQYLDAKNLTALMPLVNMVLAPILSSTA